MMDTCVLEVYSNKEIQIEQGVFQRHLHSYGTNWHRWNTVLPHKYRNEYFPKVFYVHTAGEDLYSYETRKLRISFSVPKLVYGNNLLEVKEASFQYICQLLSEKLTLMGIGIPATKIEEAMVAEVHIGKNIICHGLTMDFILRHLAMAGHIKTCGKVYRGTYETGSKLVFSGSKTDIVFYEKYSELVANKQKVNIPNFYERKDLKDIFRMEVRFKSKKAIEDNFGKSVKFKEVFSEHLWWLILMKYWTHVYKKGHICPPVCFSPEYELFLLNKQAKRKNLKTQLMLLGFHDILYSLGRKSAVEFFKRHYSGKERTAIWNYFRKYKFPAVPAEYDFLKKIDCEMKKCQLITEQMLLKAQPKMFNGYLPSKYEELLTTQDVAKCLKVNKRTVQKWCRSQQIACYRFGKEYRHSRRQLADMIHRYYQEPKHI